jgi:glucose-6-phosphate 1-dehydrogenase
VTNPTAPACTLAIFGAVGDLTKRLLMPSVYDLAVAGLLDPQTRFLGLDHNDRDTAGWRSEIGDALHEFASQAGAEFAAGHIDEPTWSSIAERLDYVRFDFTSDADYAALAQRLHDAGNVVFYFAVAPRFFETIAAGLAKAGLLKESDGAFRRLIVEKPFGHDLESARALNAHLTELAGEDQIYRIDHFLGKEAVQGIPVLRFASRSFEPLFNRDAIASVQITAAETVGVEERGSFYESTGALRDMIPNHLFSLLTLIAMDRPRSFGERDVRDAKAALLGSIRPIAPSDAARGQYAAGTSGGAAVKAYRAEDNVAPDSRTETFAALAVAIDNDRWRGVPFYIRTGKRMSAHVTTIALTLRLPDQTLFADDAATPHLLALGIDPQRGLVQRFAAKRPGVDLRLGAANAPFRYDTTFDEPPNVGYETLLYHAMRGDAMLFQRADMIEAEWAAVQPVLDAWSASTEAPQTYAAGTDGPQAAHDLLARNGDRWYDVAPLEALGAPAS